MQSLKRGEFDLRWRKYQPPYCSELFDLAISPPHLTIWWRGGYSFGDHPNVGQIEYLDDHITGQSTEAKLNHRWRRQWFDHGNSPKYSPQGAWSALKRFGILLYHPHKYQISPDLKTPLYALKDYKRG